MCTKKDELITEYDKCMKLLSEYTLPEWDKLPSLDLYMDQVIEVVNGYTAELGLFMNDSCVVTKSMINNYVKLKMMPAPEKKKYSRRHIAYILIICILKQALNISTIQKLIPENVSEEDAAEIYTSFVKNSKKAYSYVAGLADSIAAPILNNELNNPRRMNDLMLQTAASANLLKCLAEKLIDTEKQS